MVQDQSHILLNNLLYSCVDRTQRNNEQFVQEHSLGYIISGEAHFLAADGLKIARAGTIGMVKRNQLVKSVKIPPPNGEFKAINIFFSQDILRRYSAEHNLRSTGKYSFESCQQLPDDPFIRGYFESLQPYFKEPLRMNKVLTELKTI
jgi:hypothetical protein